MPENPVQTKTGEGRVMKLGVIGNPVSQSPSPVMFRAAFQAGGFEASYAAWCVREDELAEYVEKVRRDEIHGFNVTIPHKQGVTVLVDGLTEIARRIGAVNTVYHKEGKVIGHNTDGSGYLRALNETFAPDLAKIRVTLLGAGGAALAVAHVLCENGLKKIHVVNRDEARARRLLEALVSQYGIQEKKSFSWEDLQSKILTDTDLLIHATPLGMKGRADWGDLNFLNGLPSRAVVSDIVANPIETALIRAAKTRGLKTLPGHGMLLYQGVEAFETFTGQVPDVAVMREALLKTLTP